MAMAAWTQTPEVVAGKWDNPDDAGIPPFRCRWFFSWSELAPGRIAGFFAGYEGGGAFVEERFHAMFCQGRLSAFVWNGRDHLQGIDVSHLPLPEDVAPCTERHFDIFAGWHDQAHWDQGFLCLAPGHKDKLKRLPGSLFLPPQGAPDATSRIALMAACTGILCSFPAAACVGADQ
jgi:hypothetical protein